jgi:hypothetical protein
MTDKEKVKTAILKYYNDHDKNFPTINWLCAYTKMPIAEIKKYRDELQEEGLISKYATNWYVKKEFADSVERKKDFIAPVMKQIKSGVKVFTSEVKKIKFSMVWFIQVSCFLITIAAIYVTSALSYEWTPTMLGEPVKALILSIMMPLFCTFSIEGAIVLFKHSFFRVDEKLKCRPIALIPGIVICFMFLFATAFDCSMIIMSQYNKRYAHEETKNKEQIQVNKESNKYDLKKEQKERQERVVRENEIKRDEEKNKLNKLAIGTKEYNTQNWYLMIAENKLTEARKELKIIETALEGQIEKTEINVEQGEDGYAKLAKQFGVNVADVEFFLFSILAVFLVVVAPFSAFVSLGMWRQK